MGIGANRYVNSHNFPVQVKQRAAGVPRVNRCIGLQQMLIFPIFLAVLTRDPNAASFLGAKHTGRDCMVKALRVANRYKPLAYLRIIGVAQRNGREIITALNL
ncbi:hypothetical protein D3C77_492220 [compost metagenome]